MQLSAALALIAGLCATPAVADCSVGLSTPGVLKLSPSDSTVLTSEAGAASVVVVTNLSNLLGTTVTLSSPTLDTWPAGFAAGSAVVEQRYSATWLLGTSSSSSFSGSQRSFAVPLAAVVTLVLDDRVTAPGGFRQGGYSTRTSISCS
jgi:hypothetical protein